MKRLFVLLLTLALVSCGVAPSQDTTAVTTDGVTTDEVTTEPTVTEEIVVGRAHIHSISELNKDAVLDSHADDYAESRLESNYRELISLDADVLKTEVAFYPRVKQLPDGTFILFYQNGNHGPDVLYCLSEDGFEYGEPKELFKGTQAKLYSTCDAIVLHNGDILAVVTYRRSISYLEYPNQCGIAIKRSSDGGKSWSEEQVIFTGCNWEPSLLQLKSGEIQVYWTNTTGLRTAEGTFTSTGTAILRSYDNGYTWTGDVKKAWSGQIVSQSKTENIKGVQMFSDQMPVAVELHNGRIALALETRLDRVPNFRLSISYSDDNWATALEAFKQTGPSTKLENFCIGAGPYIGQFDSGETVISYNRKNFLTFRLGSTDAEAFGDEYAPYENVYTNYWGCFDIISSHSLITASEYRTKVNSAEYNYIVSGRLYLNHRIDAKTCAVTVDGKSDDWNDNTDALFVGSLTQAQCSVRFAKDGDCLAVLCERLDYDHNTESDTQSVMFASSVDSKTFYTVKFGVDGVRSVSCNDNGKTSSVEFDSIEFASHQNEAESEKDEQAGYVAELKIPLSLLGGLDDGFVCNILLQNADQGKNTQRDTLTGTGLSKPSTWYSVNFVK